MFATVDVKNAPIRARNFYNSKYEEKFYSRWKRFDAVQGTVEYIYYNFGKHDWYVGLSTSKGSFTIPTSGVFFDHQINGAQLRENREILKWAQPNSVIPQNDGSILEVDWGTCDGNVISALSASDNDADEVIMNLVAENYNYDANGNNNNNKNILPNYLNDDIEDGELKNNASNEQGCSSVDVDVDADVDVDVDVHGNQNYEADVSGVESSDGEYYDEFGLNHDV